MAPNMITNSNFYIATNDGEEKELGYVTLNMEDEINDMTPSDLLLCKGIDTEFTFKMSKKAHYKFLKAVGLITPKYKKIKKGKRYVQYEKSYD